MFWIHGGGALRRRERRLRPDPARPAGARRRHDQLPARLARLPRPPGAERGVAGPRLGQLRLHGPAGGAALGQAQHRQVRRRPGQRHDLRPVGRRAQRARPARIAARRRAVPPRDRAERRLCGQPAVAVAGREPRQRASPDTVGCPDQTAACLRSVPVATLLADQPARRTPIVPNVDGNVLPQSPEGGVRERAVQPRAGGRGLDHDEFRSYAATLVPDVPASLLSARRAGVRHDARHERETRPTSSSSTRSPTTTGDVQARRVGDRHRLRFGVPGRRDAQALSKFVPTRAYEFNDPNPPTVLVPPVANFPFGAYHASELPSLFDSDDARRPRSADARPRAARRGDGALLDPVRGDR